MRKSRGFTLIEILIVVVIIGILAAIAIPKFINNRDKAILASMISDLRNLATAQEVFYGDNQTYATGINPTQTPVLVAFVPSQGNVITLSSVASSGWAGEATNPSLKGTRTKCGIYIGSGAPPNGAVTKEGTPVCY